MLYMIFQYGLELVLIQLLSIGFNFSLHSRFAYIFNKEYNSKQERG